MTYKPFLATHTAATPAKTATVATSLGMASAIVAKVAGVAAVCDSNTDSFEERAAICEYDGGLTRDAAEQMAALHAAPLPAGITEEQRAVVIDAAALFLDRRRREAGTSQDRRPNQ
jgi:hypothetical protein